MKLPEEMRKQLEALGIKSAEDLKEAIRNLPPLDLKAVTAKLPEPASEDGRKAG